jgi:DNA-binding transcriptional ArsR family regulator
VDGEQLEPDLADALDDVGDSAGEAWLNLLGALFDAGPPYDAEQLVVAVSSLDPIELRRHLLGRYAWSWCTLGGTDDIEAAAEGDREAVERLLDRPRYYAGHARDSLETLLSVDPAETQRRLAVAARAGSRHLLGASIAVDLEAAAELASSTVVELPAADAIERLTRGYRYVPELEAERVVLVPHLEPSLHLVLAQHRAARVIVYRAVEERGREDRALALGRALSDPKRVEILVLIGRGIGRASQLVAETGLTRSTVHHHLALLREAGLVALEGNARAYTYGPRREAAEEAASLVAGLIGLEEL